MGCKNGNELCNTRDLCTACRLDATKRQEIPVVRVDVCTTCGVPAHASETNDNGDCLKCIAKKCTTLGDQHMFAVHGDGSECEDGCDRAADPERMKLLNDAHAASDAFAEAEAIERDAVARQQRREALHEDIIAALLRLEVTLVPRELIEVDEDTLSDVLIEFAADVDKRQQQRVAKNMQRDMSELLIELHDAGWRALQVQFSVARNDWTCWAIEPETESAAFARSFITRGATPHQCVALFHAGEAKEDAR